MNWPHLIQKTIGFCLVGSLLSACVTNSPDDLFAVPLDAPLEQPSKTGKFPTIGHVPKGQTTQITPTEKAATKTELNQSAVKGKQQAAQDSQSEYRREISEMRKLAASQRKKRLADIESRKF